jgi:hypothetical protein
MAGPPQKATQGMPNSGGGKGRNDGDPYHTFVGVLFAVILERIAHWITNLAPNILPGMLRTESTRAIPPATDKVYTVGPHTELALIILVFFYVIYLWLYFSRILVFLVEDAVGETLTFVLGFFVLAGASVLTLQPSYWPYVLAAITGINCIKLAYIYVELRRRRDHPFIEYIGNWIGSSLGYTAIFAVIGSVLNNMPFGSRRPTENLLLAVVIFASCVQIFYRFHIMERKVSDKMQSLSSPSSDPNAD